MLLLSALDALYSNALQTDNLPPLCLLSQKGMGREDPPFCELTEGLDAPVAKMLSDLLKYTT